MKKVIAILVTFSCFVFTASVQADHHRSKQDKQVRHTSDAGHRSQSQHRHNDHKKTHRQVRKNNNGHGSKKRVVTKRHKEYLNHHKSYHDKHRGHHYKYRKTRYSHQPKVYFEWGYLGDCLKIVSDHGHKYITEVSPRACRRYAW